MSKPKTTETASAPPEKVAHTPGPWATSKVGNNYDQFMIYGGGEDTLVCNTVSGGANARLIAAAPELLAALRQVLAILNQPWKDCDGPKTLQIAKADCSIARQQINAAIANAEAALQ